MTDFSRRENEVTGSRYNLFDPYFKLRHQGAFFDRNSLIRYIENEDNGLKKTHKENNFKLSVTYRPTDFIVQQQMIRGTPKEFDSLTASFSRYIYFNLSIAYGNKDLESEFGRDPGSFADRVSFLSSDFSRGIKLLTKKDTFDILDFIYTRTYGIDNSNFMLVFYRQKSEHFEIQVTGYELGFGKISFPFEQSDIEKTPRLKIKLK